MQSVSASNEPSKVCSKCKETKPVSEFHKKGAGLRRADCTECRSEFRTGKWPETAEQRLRRKLWSEYGLTFEQYVALFDAQGGACAICGIQPTAGKRLAVDHCHATGVVRALLCTRCNLAVGFYETQGRATAKYLATYGNGNPLLSK